MALVSTNEGTLDKAIVRDWCKKFHYAKRVPSISYAYGWVGDSGELEAILTIGKPASNAPCIGVCGAENKSYVYELNRICAKETLSIPLSQFVGMVLKDLPNLVLISYSDTQWNHVGYIYQATNWLYTGATRRRTDPLSGSKHSRHTKCLPDAKRQERSSKHRYVTFTGDKRFKKSIKKSFKWETFEYPKGDTQKYHIDWKA